MAVMKEEMRCDLMQKEQKSALEKTFSVFLAPKQERK